MKKALVNLVKIVLVLMILISFVITIILATSGRNSMYQSVATIDYQYSAMTGGDPSLADEWLAVEYCENTIAYELFYPQEYKDKCEYILENAGN